jgi:hypothetical protein
MKIFFDLVIILSLAVMLLTILEIEFRRDVGCKYYGRIVLVANCLRVIYGLFAIVYLIIYALNNI